MILTISQALQLLPLLIAAAQDAKPVVDAAKNLITSWFNKGLISKQTQDDLHAHCDALMEAALAGAVPPEFVVRPDPISASVLATVITAAPAPVAPAENGAAPATAAESPAAPESAAEPNASHQ